MSKFIVLLAFFGISLQGFSSEFEGRFEKTHPISLSRAFTPTAEDCKFEDGRWIEEGGFCIVEVQDFVQINKVGVDQFQVFIDKTGNNARSCQLEIVASKKSHLLLEGSKPVEVYKDGKFEMKSCDVKVIFSNSDTLSIEATDACDSECGMGVTPSLKNATRVEE